MVFGFSSLGSLATVTTTLLALQQQLHQQPASTIIKKVRTIYEDLEPCNVTSMPYPSKSRGAIQFSHVFSSQEAREEISTAVATNTKDKSDLLHQVASSHGYTKPLLIYLPGLDAAGISAYTQFPSLAESFELWRMTVDKDDCSTTFLDLTNAAVSFIEDTTAASNRTVVLVGESFGGLLAPSVALRVQHKLTGLVLVNPATSFDQTQWTSLLPLLASVRQNQNKQVEDGRPSSSTSNRNRNNNRGILPPRFPTPYSLLGGILLSLTIPDQRQFGQIVNLVQNVPVRNQEDLDDVLESLIDGFHILQDRLPEATITHRIKQWLTVGTQVINPRLGELRVKTVIIAGNEDKMLPTKQESTRLLSIIPNSTKFELKTSGHFTLDDRVNLTHIILEESDIFPKKKEKHDPIVDWKPPAKEYTQQRIDESIKPLRLLAGPVFFSTDKNGIRHRGLGFLPPKNGGPILFVANHQFGGQDIRLIVPQLIEDLGLYVRGLAHPILFQAAREGNGTFFGDPDYFKYGIVEVTPRNYYRLMETGQAALLFPGGVREVFHGKNEAYKLFWPEKVDFVRIAAKFNATIIPLSAVGAAESVNILIDPPDMLKLPFGLGEQLEKNSRSVAAARFDANSDGELFVPPFALPTPLPARHYFIFGKPIETHELDPKDRAVCSKVYAEIQSELNRGFSDLLRAREKDPFKDTARRIVFELATGKPAPTFSVEDLNNGSV